MSELVLALDVGNTNTVVGLFDDSRLVTRWRLATHPERTAEMILHRTEQVGSPFMCGGMFRHRKQGAPIAQCGYMMIEGEMYDTVR